MTGRNPLKTAVVGVAVGLSALAMPSWVAAARSPARKPNIILVMADDVGYEWFSCYGGKEIDTPHVDSLARTGVRFDYGFSQPLCTPSRVQIMTGRYNNRNYQCFGYLDPQEITFANLLKNAGYKTCIAGKWQLSGNADTVKKFGFDEHCLWNMRSYGKRAAKVERPKNDLNRYWSPCLFVNGKWVEHGPDIYGPDVVSDFLLDFITRHRNQPFLCYYPMILPHAPTTETPDSKRTNASGKKGARGKSFKYMVQYIDKIMGRIVAHLEAQGIRDNTLIIFVSDNGAKSASARTHHGTVRGEKGKLTHGGTHVPFIANWHAASTTGRALDDLVDFSDVLPTIVEAAGAELPGDRLIDGRSFLPQIRGERGHPREWVFCYYAKKGQKPENGTAAIWDRRWKLYGNGQMYDVKNDVLEKAPLKVLSKDAEEAKSRLQKALRKVLEKE